MAAGAVLLNIAVNAITFMLIGMALQGISPLLPFLVAAVVSAFVAVYAIYRTLRPVSYPSYADSEPLPAE